MTIATIKSKKDLINMKAGGNLKTNKNYQKPELTVHGIVENLTKGSVSGGTETGGKKKGKPGT